MTSIRIDASRSYDVLIGSGLLSEVGKLIFDITKKCRAAIISDDNVYPLYGKRVEESLNACSIDTVSYVFPHGESSKTLTTYGNVLNFLCNNHFTRSDIIVALGGGVVGDLSGFAAATYQRGIRFIQIPTTLLAMVDSSVGGKTAVDLDAGKNQAGCFYQPSLVICDTDTLSTLPDEEYKCGCAEVIKYGILGNESFFSQLNETPIKNQIENVISVCVEMKRDVVQSDEFDRGLRQKLNLGHTVGHAIEAASGFSMLHGNAVAAGMAIISKAAFAKGYCSKDTADRIESILKKYGLPFSTHYCADELCGHMLTDKKLDGSTLSLIVPTSVGSCEIVKIKASDFKCWLNAGGIE